MGRSHLVNNTLKILAHSNFSCTEDWFLTFLSVILQKCHCFSGFENFLNRPLESFLGHCRIGYAPFFFQGEACRCKTFYMENKISSNISNTTKRVSTGISTLRKALGKKKPTTRNFLGEIRGLDIVMKPSVSCVWYNISLKQVTK